MPANISYIPFPLWICKLYVEMYYNETKKLNKEGHYLMQHIINPLNMLPQDINKAQSLVQLPRPQSYQNAGPSWDYSGQEMKVRYILTHASGY